MATFTNLQYHERVLTVASTEIVGALSHHSDNQKWMLSIQGEAPNYRGLIISKGADLFMGWDDNMENVILSNERYTWKFVIDWEADTIGFQVPGSSNDKYTFITAQLEDDQSTVNLVVQSGGLTKMQQWMRDPPLLH